ncbi:MAG TPA: hypothetical protein VFM46_11075, partial [Pseudomonadales bacterium]|nr:hypothetical protein [Pseudomonadales bacterium]
GQNRRGRRTPLACAEGVYVALPSFRTPVAYLNVGVWGFLISGALPKSFRHRLNGLSAASPALILRWRSPRSFF